MSKINLDINPYTFTGSAFVIGIILANELNALEQATIGNWLQLLGMTILTYSSQVALVEANNDQEQSNDDDLDKIKKAISKINDELDK